MNVLVLIITEASGAHSVADSSHLHLQSAEPRRLPHLGEQLAQGASRASPTSRETTCDSFKKPPDKLANVRQGRQDRSRSVIVVAVQQEDK